jgi:hypothetical protein
LKSVQSKKQAMIFPIDCDVSNGRVKFVWIPVIILTGGSWPDEGMCVGHFT